MNKITQRAIACVAGALVVGACLSVVYAGSHQYRPAALDEHSPAEASRTANDLAMSLAVNQKAADLGDANSQLAMGWRYQTGTGVAEDKAQAAAWYRKAAAQGHAAAQFELALMYDIGDGVPQDDAEAINWYRKAAEQGNGPAQSNLALMYSIGEGVPQNDAEAIKLGFPRCRPRSLRSQRGITSVTATESSPRPSWPGCTTNIAWNHWQREP